MSSGIACAAIDFRILDDANVLDVADLRDETLADFVALSDTFDTASEPVTISKGLLEASERCHRRALAMLRRERKPFVVTEPVLRGIIADATIGCSATLQQRERRSTDDRVRDAYRRLRRRADAVGRALQTLPKEDGCRLGHDIIAAVASYESYVPAVDERKVLVTAQEPVRTVLGDGIGIVGRSDHVYRDTQSGQPVLRLVAEYKAGHAPLDRILDEAMMYALGISLHKGVAPKAVLAGNVWRAEYALLRVTHADLARAKHRLLQGTRTALVLRQGLRPASIACGKSWCQGCGDGARP